LNKPFTTWLPDRSEWGKGMLPFKKGGLIWYTDGSKANEGTGAGVCGHGIKQIFSFSLGYTMVFQAEVYAIKACADENIRRCYRERNIYILSDGQAAIKALDKCRINSKLVRCHLAYIRFLRLLILPSFYGCYYYLSCPSSS
jgi:hypothetical protein